MSKIKYIEEEGKYFAIQLNIKFMYLQSFNRPVLTKYIKTHFVYKMLC